MARTGTLTNPPPHWPGPVLPSEPVSVGRYCLSLVVEVFAFRNDKMPGDGPIRWGIDAGVVIKRIAQHGPAV